MKLQKASSTNLLNKILADPGLPEKIRALEPITLSKMINEVGLEDAAEIIALASVQQLEGVFDEDLWRSRKPGEDEAFDSSRFGVWVQILLEIGPKQAAEKITEMDPDFLTMAFSQLVWVVEFEWLQLQVASESGLEKIMASSHYYEIEGFVIFSRDPRTWDSILNLLVELDQDHHTFLYQILERCSYLSVEKIDDQGGLYSVLSTEEQLMEDVAGEREARRESQGYVTPANARAFLKLAEGPLTLEDHITPAKLRKLHLKSESTQKQTALVLQPDIRYAKVHALLAKDPSAYAFRVEELNYLANVLVSGSSINQNATRPGEAAQIVLETCEKGLAINPNTNSLIESFKLGWASRARSAER